MRDLLALIGIGSVATLAYVYLQKKHETPITTSSVLSDAKTTVTETAGKVITSVEGLNKEELDALAVKVKTAGSDLY